MRLHNISYLVKEGARNIFFNKLMSFACVGVLVACLLLIGSAVLFSLNINSLVRYVEDQNEVIAYLEEGLSKSDRELVDLQLGNMENLQITQFITKEEALEQERERMGDAAGLLDGLEETNPLPYTYVLSVVDIDKAEETVDQLRAVDGVEKVKYSREVIDILLKIRSTVAYAGAAIVLILVAVSLVIISNTIKLTVFSRRKEINIMKYVGATDSFIRLPFMVEGVIIGLLAASVAFFLLGFGYTYLVQWAGENYGDYLSMWINNAMVFRDIALELFGAFAALGVFIGMVSSGFFVRKFLKV